MDEYITRGGLHTRHLSESRKKGEPERTPYERRVRERERFAGKLVAFGARVYYLPTAPRGVEARGPDPLALEVVPNEDIVLVVQGNEEA